MSDSRLGVPLQPADKKQRWPRIRSAGVESVRIQRLFTRIQNWYQKLIKNRTWIRSRFLFSAIAGVCVIFNKCHCLIISNPEFRLDGWSPEFEQESDSQIWKFFGSRYTFINFGKEVESESENATPAASEKYRMWPGSLNLQSVVSKRKTSYWFSLKSTYRICQLNVVITHGTAVIYSTSYRQWPWQNFNTADFHWKAVTRRFYRISSEAIKDNNPTVNIQWWGAIKVSSETRPGMGKRCEDRKTKNYQ